MTLRGRRWLRGLAAVALGAAVVVFFAPVREPILRMLGSALFAEDPVAPADVIVVSLDAGGPGVLEAADLVHGGIATRVAVFTDPPRAEDEEFRRRGLPHEDATARQVRQLEVLGVKEVLLIPRPEAGTEGEAQALPSWCDKNGFRSVVVVTSLDHSRRSRRVLDRAMKGHPARVMVRAARYSEFEPERWWTTRGGIRIAVIELQKLMLDMVLHPV